MKHLGLFEGIGGFSLAARWMGWETVAWCEWNEFGQKVLRHHFPNAEGHGDITKTDFTKYANTIDIITGGWPCQDNSNAKQVGESQLGLKGERSGLWREVKRTICEVRPKYFLGENVSSILTINNGNDFNTILSDLAGMGYNATWGVLRASDIGAPHKRARMYILAYSGSIRSQTLHSVWTNAQQEIEKQKISWMFNGATIPVGGAWGKVTSDILRMDDDVPYRVDRFKALGNAIVPQVAFEIFKAIEQYELL